MFNQILFVDSYSSNYFKWLIVVSIFIIYNLIFIIGRAVFWQLNNPYLHIWIFFDYLSDLVYIIDSFVRLHEGYLEDGILVKNISKVRLNYLQSKKSLLDILSLFPTDILYIWWSPNCCEFKLPCPVILRVNRLFRVHRLQECFSKAATNATYYNIFKILKVFLAISILVHWNACLYFAVSYAVGFGSDNWVYNISGYENSLFQNQYSQSFYWSTMILTKLSEMPKPNNNIEYTFVIVDYLAGVIIFATIVGNIGSVINNLQAERMEFQEKTDHIKKYLRFRKVGNDLEKKVFQWLEYSWVQSLAFNEEKLLSILPNKLKAEIAIKAHFETLRKVWLFQDCDPGLLEALILKLKLQVFSPGDYVCKKGDVGREMYIVKRGVLEVVSDDNRISLARLVPGSVFGELSILDIHGNRTGNRRTANVRSLGYSDLFCLEKADLLSVLIDYPEAKMGLIRRGCELLQKDGLLVENIEQSIEQTLANFQSKDNLENYFNQIIKINKDILINQRIIMHRLEK